MEIGPEPSHGSEYRRWIKGGAKPIGTRDRATQSDAVG